MGTAHEFTSDDLAYCQRLLAGGSRSFYLAGKLLPAASLNAVTALYAFCRVADDLVDDAEDSARELDRLGERLNRVYAGTPLDFPEDRGLAYLVERWQLPRAPLDALLEGFAWDATTRSYDTLLDVEAYGARVAGSVGIMMAWLLGERRPQPLARALDLGVAMQLTNICRDVGEDARMGRLYLPAELLREQGLDPARFRTQPLPSPELAAVIRQLLERADRLYLRAEQGIQCLPSRARFSIRAAAALYQAIGTRLREQGCDSVTVRSVVPRPRQLRLVAGALLPRRRDSERLAEPVLPACEYLLKAALEAGAPAEPGNTGFVQMLDLLLKVKARQEQNQ
ncbi:MAG: phytoene/squalene synthase family protein [Pseudomonadota bacterium]